VYSCGPNAQWIDAGWWGGSGSQRSLESNYSTVNACGLAKTHVMMGYLVLLSQLGGIRVKKGKRTFVRITEIAY
jgi:hypothetical protein